jgi:hypothetical protein
VNRGFMPEIRRPWYGSPSKPERGYIVRLWNCQTGREANVQSLDGIDEAIEELGPYDPERRPVRHSRLWWCWNTCCRPFRRLVRAYRLSRGGLGSFPGPTVSEVMGSEDTR